MAKGLKKNLINDSTIELLSRFEILRNLSHEELKTLLRGKETSYEARIAKLIRFEPEETVIREGDFDSWSFWIVTGSYNIVIADTVIATLNVPGEIFGEMSVLDGIPRTASVVAVKEGICLGIDMSILTNLDDEYIVHIITSGFKQKKMERLNLTHLQVVKEKQAIDSRYTTLLKLEKDLKKREDALAQKEEMLYKKEQELIKREIAMMKLDSYD
ncbi:hypothetical protein MTBBW1_400020 [Desulfamplus magnetovallimortis]|uniref:Cyclic nucleotide-binding domain-containing protein n=2 Tax=Desulfamplus magnetovallimortis TaxID=1246637 RepID=A0A1W1HGR0_9BACT|nr:hypothetical protein MTBBW1_400020 [Desulfamplus magnetovallimortis]